jgi:ABC-type glycerol-3-phosphate transport system substrate-binding protein
MKDRADTLPAHEQHAHDIGRRRLSRKRTLQLGAAGVAAAAAPLTHLDRAFAFWNARLPASLQGTITFQAYLYESGSGSAVTGKQPGLLYGEYLKKHPGVQLQMLPEPSNAGDWNAWFLPRAIANRLPDLMQPAVSCWPFTQQGYMTSITKYLHEPNPYIAGNKRWIDSVPKGFLDPFIGLDGEYYGFGADTAAIWLYYNAEHLDRINAKPPATWAELMDISARLQAKGITPFSMAGVIPFNLSQWFLFAESSLWASEFPAGTSLTVAEWVKAIKKGMLKKTDQRTRAAWKLVKDFGAYWAKGSLAIDQFNTSLYHDFAQGKFTFMLDGSWEITTLQSLLKGHFPVAAVPTGFPVITKQSSPYANGSPQGYGAPAMNGIDIWVSQHAKDHLDLVVDFLRYYSSPQVMGPMALEVGEVPVVSGVSNLPPLVAQAGRVANQPGLLNMAYINADPTFTQKYGQLSRGYLSGALSLDVALTTLDGVQQSVVDKLAAKMHL